MKKYLTIIFSTAACLLAVFFLTAEAGKEKPELIFSHKLHVVENGMECSACHGSAETSVLGSDNLMPDMESCGTCHDVESPDNCGTCHSDVDNPRNVPRVAKYFPQFSHQQHIAQGLDCAECHSPVIQKEAIGEYILPAMESCQECHTEKRVKPKTHGPNYRHAHGDDSRVFAKTIRADQTCRACHSLQYCQTCHEGDNLDRTTHPLNYAFTHALEAQGKDNQCATCHIDRSFCIECHQQYFVLPHNHTAGWANRADGGRHVDAARSDLENCMSCHEQDAALVCQKCHAK